MEYQVKITEHGLEWICGLDFEPQCPDCMSKRNEFISSKKTKEKDNKVYHIVKLRCNGCHCQYILYRAEE